MSESIEYQEKEMSYYDRFIKYCESQSEQSTLWFLVPLVTLAGSIMPLAIFLILYFGLPGFLTYVAIAVPLFFINLVVHISGYPTKVTIPLYLITALFNLLFPIVALLFV